MSSEDSHLHVLFFMLPGHLNATQGKTLSPYTPFFRSPSPARMDTLLASGSLNLSLTFNPAHAMQKVASGELPADHAFGKAETVAVGRQRSEEHTSEPSHSGESRMPSSAWKTKHNVNP